MPQVRTPQVRMQASNAPRMYRSPHVRWVARRPPETLPPRRVRVAPAPRLIPRYTYLPRWGLYDPPATGVAEERTSADHLRPVLRGLGAVLALTAVVHLIRYLLLTINRSTPVPGWAASLTWGMVWVTGLAALIGFVVAILAFGRWLIAVRADSYRRGGTREPRRGWVIWLCTVIPLVNIFGILVLVREGLAMRTDLDEPVALSRARKIWLAWILVNGIAVLAVLVRYVAWRSGSIQTGADGLWLTALSAAVSSAFAFWLPTRLQRLFGQGAEKEPQKRWVPVEVTA